MAATEEQVATVLGPLLRVAYNASGEELTTEHKNLFVTVYAEVYNAADTKRRDDAKDFLGVLKSHQQVLFQRFKPTGLDLMDGLGVTVVNPFLLEMNALLDADPLKIVLQREKEIWKLPFVEQGTEEGTNSPAYFIPLSSKIRFRHAGHMNGGEEDVPKKVFLCPPKRYAPTGHGENKHHAVADLDDEKVAVYFSASGTGKSIELAASSHTRKTLLSLMLVVNDGDGPVPSGAATKDRNAWAFNLLESQFAKVLLESHKEALGKVLKACTSRETIPISVCIDEASSCPLLVRSIISDVNGARDAVKKGLTSSFPSLANIIDKIVPVFSIGGTGAAEASVGSLAKNYVELHTSASISPAIVYETLLKEATRGEPCDRFNIKGLKENYPLLLCLAEDNARMASILVYEIASSLGKSFSPTEAFRNTMKHFMSSNGLAPLLGSARRACTVAAQAFAVHLFQEPYTVPGDSLSKHKAMTDLNFGPVFDTQVVPVSMQTLVRTYGLIVPSPFDEATLTEPFLLGPAMQVLCLYMLGVDSVDILEESAFGFEVLTTQLIKAVIAASLTMPKADRLDLGALLQLIGFRLPLVKDHPCMAQSAKQIWAKLSDLKPVRFKPPHTDKENARKSWLTSQQKCEATTFDDVVFDHRGTPYVQSTLFLDKDFKETLEKIEPPDANTEEHDGFCAPICSVAIGNSDLVDAYVACCVQEMSTQVYSKFSVGNQAKDYKNGTKLNFASLSVQVEKMEIAAFDDLLGKLRLYCVATKEEAWKPADPSKVKVDRSFVGFAVEKSQILSCLLPELEKLRDSKARARLHGCNVICKNEQKTLEDVYAQKSVAWLRGEYKERGGKTMKTKTKKHELIGALVKLVRPGGPAKKQRVK